MVTYTVWYKCPSRRWCKIEEVKGDGIIPETGNRWFICDDETRYEIPREAIIKFSKERWYLIKERMSNEAGQDIRIEKG